MPGLATSHHAPGNLISQGSPGGAAMAAGIASGRFYNIR